MSTMHHHLVAVSRQVECRTTQVQWAMLTICTIALRELLIRTASSFGAQTLFKTQKQEDTFIAHCLQ